jgi:hypothetical protein
MRRSFPVWLGLSLAAHVAAFGALVHANASANASASASANAEAPARPVLAGDTLEVPGLEAALDDESAIDLDQEPLAVPEPAAGGADRLEPRPRAKPRRRLVVRGAPPTPDGEPSGDGEPARFGAVGERGAVDLATAFTRGFPQAASADPVWMKAPFGAAGALDVRLSLDDTGHLAGARLEPGGSAELRQAVARTVALIRGRTFTARAATTRLHVRGVVSADAVRNEARGADVFAIGGSYAGRSGSAFFSLAIGRRVDVTITER